MRRLVWAFVIRKSPKTGFLTLRSFYKKTNPTSSARDELEFVKLACCMFEYFTFPTVNNKGPGPEVIKLFSYSTQLSTKFQMLIKLKYRQMKKFLALCLSDVVFIMLINVKMPTIVGILTFMGRINFMLS